MAMAEQGSAWQCCEMGDIRQVASEGLISRQLVRYAVVGVITNAAGYLVYLLITYLGVVPKVAMSILYVVGVIASFFGNKRLTFSYNGGVLGAGVRHLIVYMLGYFLNLGLLIMFVDHFGYPHQFVQGLAIFVTAAFLFVTLKHFVFRSLNTKC